MVLHTELERKLPGRWLEKVDKAEIIEYPNECKSKKGVMDFILKKWFGSPFSEESKFVTKYHATLRQSFPGDIVMENSEDYVMNELAKTKAKLRHISQTLETQNQFLRLIVQVCTHFILKIF